MNRVVEDVTSALNFLQRLVGGNSNQSVRDNMDDIDDENGFIFCADDGQTKKDFYVPEEILAVILSYVDIVDLVFRCRLVCHSWRQIVETFALRYKAERECPLRLKKSVLGEKQKNKKVILPWYVYYSINKKNVFGKNLLKNNCGQEKYKYWNILSNGGDRFRIEQVPSGADPLPESDDFQGKTSCFATSYHSNSKMQIINLAAEGLTPKIMDCQPIIRVSEWFAGRYDCGCTYELKVALLDRRKKPITEFEHREQIEQWEGREWKKVEHEFSNYGSGVQYIQFYHGGMDKQFWAGHFGSKMAGGVVKLFYKSYQNESGTGDKDNS